ncbi:MAG: hypothetical protein JXR61_07215 [Prolixibacteraceae bacterium]|nr:hypothetical protein [Bacteroidales bacterium]MBN2636042.1 hypothetical protein [Prolixibacteraceae bacterium]
MSLTARLHIEEHPQEKTGIKILSCSFSFSQDVDSNGKIASNVRSGLINVSIPGINDTELIRWMLGKDTRRNGRIVFSGVMETGPNKTLEFEDAVLVSYYESFTDQSDMIINLGISSRKIIVNGESNEMFWDPGPD